MPESADHFVTRRAHARMLRSLRFALWALVVICTALLMSGLLVTRQGLWGTFGVELLAFVLLILLHGEQT